MSTELTPAQEKLYAEAEELSGYNALSLKAMALWAYEHRKDKEAMRVASFCWGRNARLMAKSVDWFGAYYLDDYSPTVDEMLSIFAMCQLPYDQAWDLESERMGKTLNSWQVRERVAELKQRKPRNHKAQTVACPKCGKTFEV